MTEHIPQIGEVVGRYRILEVIGRGSTGPVYRAWDETLAREVALKTLWPQFQSDERVRSRFEREARAIAKLESPHIVRVYDVGEIDNAPFIAMEYIRGGEVTSPLDSRRAAEVVRDVAVALERAHENGIIHRDIKPANVMIGTDGRAKLADFGLARAIADEATLMTNTGTLLGTPAFLAPEIIEGHEATPLSDIYSLGILLYRLVAGRAPFDESSPAAVLRAHLKGDIPRIPNASGPLNDVIAGCTALKPENRYPTATFVREDLDSVLAGRPIAGPPRDQTRIDFAVPFWARFIPGAQKTLIDLSDAVRQTESKSAARRRSLEEAHAIAQDLESRKAESDRHASGWRSVAERLLAEGKENDVREALESAQAFDAEAEKYKQELETQNEFVRRVERDLRACEADTESARSQAALLRSRRHRATFGMIARRRPVSAIAAGIAILVAGITIFALAAPKKAAEPPANIEPTSSVTTPAADASPYTVVFESIGGWPIVWMENGVFNIFYGTSNDLVHATSSDGLLWSPPNVLSAAANRTTPRMIPGTHRGLSAFKQNNFWSIHGIEGLPEAFRDMGNVPFMPSVNPGVYEPGSVIKTDNGFVLYGDGGAHGFMNGLYTIFRSESADGRIWSKPEIVITGNDRGLPMGHVAKPNVSFDPASGEWTIWYTATDGVSADERTYICRAKSSDGKTFRSHEVFLTPEELGRPEISRLQCPSYVSTEDGDYLYFTAEGPVGGMPAQFLRMKIQKDSGNAAIKPLFTDVLRGDLAWEKGSVGQPVIWSENGLLNMHYTADMHQGAEAGHATSIDGITWNKSRTPIRLSAPDLDRGRSPIPVPGTDIFLNEIRQITRMNRTGMNLWEAHAWRRTAPDNFQSLKTIFEIKEDVSGNFHPGNIVKMGDRFVLYGNYAQQGIENGVSRIFRSESSDGVNWKAPEIIVASDDRAATNGLAIQVIHPYVHYDQKTGIWTLWYIASYDVTDHRLSLYRATSRDGKTFHSHQLFLHPKSLGTGTRIITLWQATVPDGDYLYLEIDDGQNTNNRIGRLNIKDPHLATPPG